MARGPECTIASMASIGRILTIRADDRGRREHCERKVPDSAVAFTRRLREVDVVSKTGLASVLQQPKQTQPAPPPEFDGGSQ
jgi:hypothetical protein